MGAYSPHQLLQSLACAKGLQLLGTHYIFVVVRQIQFFELQYPLLLILGHHSAPVRVNTHPTAGGATGVNSPGYTGRRKGLVPIIAL